MNHKNFLIIFLIFLIFSGCQTIKKKSDSIAKKENEIYGKFVGKDSFGNMYYKNKTGKRWVIYNGEIDATKIPSDWYSWMHHMHNKIENDHDLKKYHWQKEHLPNQTGTSNSYHPKKFNNAIKKKYKSWKS